MNKGNGIGNYFKNSAIKYKSYKTTICCKLFTIEKEFDVVVYVGHFFLRIYLFPTGVLISHWKKYGNSETWHSF